MTATDVSRFVISDHPNSDTDTNACIVGYVAGALLGWTAMQHEENVVYNWPLVVASTQPDSKTQVPRAAPYRLDDVDQLENQLVVLSIPGQ